MWRMGVLGFVMFLSVALGGPTPPAAPTPQRPAAVAAP